MSLHLSHVYCFCLSSQSCQTTFGLDIKWMFLEKGELGTLQSEASYPHRSLFVLTFLTILRGNKSSLRIGSLRFLHLLWYELKSLLKTQGSPSFVKTVRKWNSTITERSSNNRLWIKISVSEIGEKLQRLACFINDSIICGSDPNTLRAEPCWMARVLCFLLLIKRVYFSTLYRRIMGQRQHSLSFFLALSVFMVLIQDI